MCCSYYWKKAPSCLHQYLTLLSWLHLKECGPCVCVYICVFGMISYSSFHYSSVYSFICPFLLSSQPVLSFSLSLSFHSVFTFSSSLYFFSFCSVLPTFCPPISFSPCHGHVSPSFFNLSLPSHYFSLTCFFLTIPVLMHPSILSSFFSSPSQRKSAERDRGEQLCLLSS